MPLIRDFKSKYIESVILDTYGDVVSIPDKKKNLIKFGRNENVGNTGFRTVWQNTEANEVYLSSNGINTVSSSNAGDTQQIIIEGHTISGGELTFVIQTVTLDGQNKVTLSTPLARANRAYNNSGTIFSGDVYVYEDTTISGGVPTDATKIHLKAPILDNQSLKCATSISNSDYWIIESLVGSANRNSQSRNVDFKLQIRELGKVFRTVYPFSASTESGTRSIILPTPIIVPKNHDVRVIAQASGTTTIVQAVINGYLASVQ